MDYKFCECIGHWKHEVVCKKNIDQGKCFIKKQKCHMKSRIPELSDEERQRRSDWMKQLRQEK